MERCPRCRLAFLWPPPSAESLEAIYGSYYREDNAALNRVTESRYHEILARLEGNRGPGRILDVGCGAGQLLEVALRRGWDAEGTEMSPAASPFLEARGIRVHRKELPDLELDGPFDAVTLFEVLEHVRRPQAHLEAARRLLRPGGRLYLTTPNFDGLSRRLLGSRWRVIAPEHLSYYSARALRLGLERAGFEGVSIRSKNLDVADLRRKLFARGGGSEGYSNIAETTALRERIEGRRGLAAAKALVNWALRLTGTGDTLDALARRPRQNGSP